MLISLFQATELVGCYSTESAMHASVTPDLKLQLRAEEAEISATQWIRVAWKEHDGTQEKNEIN